MAFRKKQDIVVDADDYSADGWREAGSTSKRKTKASKGTNGKRRAPFGTFKRYNSMRPGSKKARKH